MSKHVSTIDSPHHLSVGAILRNDKGEYLVLHGKDGRVAFMCGTVEDDESLEQCLHRELNEEMGATCRIDSFAGCTTVQVSGDPRGDFEKTTVWFRCTPLTYGGPRQDEADGSPVLIHADRLDRHAKYLSKWPTGLLMPNV